MTYDYGLLFEVIFKTAARRSAIHDRMVTVIDECERQIPHADWEEYRRCDFNADVPRLDSWLRSGLTANDYEPRGLWFGIFNPSFEDGYVADVYIAGSPAYSEDPSDDLAWARLGSRSGHSVEMGSRALRQLYQLAYRNNQSLGNKAEYPLALAYTAMIIIDGLLALDTAKLKSVEGAAVGFDSGDYFYPGSFSEGKFIPGPRWQEF